MSSIDLLNNMRGGDGLGPIADHLEASLTPIGVLRLMAVALRIAPEQEAVGLCDAFLGYHSAGYPIPSFLGVVDDAKWHASIATPSEGKVYCLAHFQSMTTEDQARFLSYVSQMSEEE
jgi:hypothetical protein